MNSEIKEALLSFSRRELRALGDELRCAESARFDAILRSHQKVLWALEDDLRRAESARHNAALAAIAAQAEHEKAITDAYKKGFIDAWNLPR